MTDSIHKNKLHKLDKPMTFGNNNLPSNALFVQRKAYTKLVGEWYPHPYLLDFWYDRPFHSKVDRKYNSVYISETNLKQIFPIETTGFEKKSHFAADFVADAYHDFQFYIKNKLKDSGSRLHDIKPIFGWMSANKLHHMWVNATYKAFSNIYINEGNRSRRIKSFGTFMEVFYEFIGPTLGDAPFTKSGFIVSKHYPNHGGGLMIETALESHADDFNKHLKYFRDPYFDLYKDLAKDFGFKLDKNAPWRLIADIESPRMQSYMVRYGVNAKNLFDQYYYKSFIYDIETMKINLLAFYNSYITASPFYKILKSCPSDQTMGGFPSFVTKQTIVSRKPITMEELNHQYSPLYWLLFYFEIRMKEINVGVSKAKFNDVKNKIIKMNKMFDFPTALDYTNEIIRKKWAKRMFKEEKGITTEPQSTTAESSISTGGGSGY